MERSSGKTRDETDETMESQIREQLATQPSRSPQFPIREGVGIEIHSIELIQKWAAPGSSLWSSHGLPSRCCSKQKDSPHRLGVGAAPQPVDRTKSFCMSPTGNSKPESGMALKKIGLGVSPKVNPHVHIFKTAIPEEPMANGDMPTPGWNATECGDPATAARSDLASFKSRYFLSSDEAPRDQSLQQGQ